MGDRLEDDLRALATKAVAASEQVGGELVPHRPAAGLAGWRRQVLGAVAAVAAGALLVGIGVVVASRDHSRHTGVVTTAPPPAPSPPMSAAALDLVARQVEDMGTANGPVRYAEGPRSVAGPVLSGGDSTGGPLAEVAVWAVVVPGSFVDTKSYGPLGAPDPTGTYLAFTVSVSTQPEVLDFGLADRAPDLTSLGPVGTVALPTGTLTGRATPCQGPLPGTGSTATRPEVTVEVLAAHRDDVIARRTVASSSTYRFVLPAGQYRVRAGAEPSAAVTVMPHQTTTAHLPTCR
jgi:hypothetical protein